eukprot:scaffold3823_cov195-Amphora_coffeaeformis.AAC.17
MTTTTATTRSITATRLSAVLLLLAFGTHTSSSLLVVVVVDALVVTPMRRPGLTTTSRSDSVSTVALASTAISVEQQQQQLPSGLEKTVIQSGDDDDSFAVVQRGDIVTLQYACYVVDNDNDDNNGTNTNKMNKQAPFCKARQQKMVVGDGSMIPGWDAALRSMRIGERSVFRVSDPALGYAAAGVPPLVPPDAVLELDITVWDAQPPTANIDFDNLALDSTPTTAADIARAYEVRRAARGDIPQEEGFAGFIQKAKNFYFFGLFEGETGERAPWFLRPSITFPLAFVIVGATFYVTFLGGGISERGQQTTDELDEIILTTTTLSLMQIHLGL